MNHFDEMTALLYLDGQLERGQAAETLTHANACAECRALIESLKKETIFLEQSLREKDPVPARFAAPARKSTLPWGWITVFGMAAAGIFTVWNGFVEPFEQQLNQAGFTGGNLMTMLFFSGAFWKGWTTVLSFLEFFTAAAFAMLVLALLQRFWRHARSATVGMMLAAILIAPFLLIGQLLLAPTANAAETVHGKPNYTLAAGQTVDTDLFVAADFTRIDGTINGDLIAWSNEVEINGRVTGDVIAMSRELRITGQVDGNVRSYAQTLAINGTVGKNVLAADQDFEMGTNGKVGGSLTLGTSSALISGSIGRDVMTGGGEMTFNGTVGGNARFNASDYLRIGPEAEIHGTTQYKGRHAAEVDSQAKLASPVVFTRMKQGPDYSSWRYYWHRALFWGAAFLLGLVILLLLPGFFHEGLQASRRFLPSLGLGAVFMFATPFVAGILCFTVVGIGLAIPTVFVWLIALYAAQVFAATQIGNFIFRTGAGTGALVGRLAVGLVIIHALEMVPYHVGFLTKVIVLWWGLGAIVIAIHRHLHRVMTAPAAVAA